MGIFMETLKTALRTKKAKLLASSSAVLTLGASGAYADYSGKVTEAITQGETVVGLLAPGIVGIAALMLGVGLVISWIRK